ncbi:MAG: nuclear transport factor 2 family protein [Candidatus Nanopelagicales bacterium]
MSMIADVADRLFATIEAGDVTALAALWSEDIIVWRLGGGRERDKPRGLKVIEWFVDRTTSRRYEVLDRQVFDGGFLQQHNVHATTLTGGLLTFRAVLVVKVGPDDLITKIDEYLDPADLNPLAAES